MSRFEPPPSMRLMIKVEMLGTNTMVMPVVMPGMDSGTSTCAHNVVQVCAKVLRGLDDAVVDFDHDGVQRQHHIGQIVVHHAQHHRARGVDHVERPNAEQAQKAVDEAVVLQKGHPRIGAQQKIHPHGQHDQHLHHAAGLRAACGRA